MRMQYFHSTPDYFGDQINRSELALPPVATSSAQSISSPSAHILKYENAMDYNKHDWRKPEHFSAL
jgi:hypothetical protein